jgi:hypothetical protein
MEPEGSLPCSQKPAIGPYPETNESNPHSPILFPDDPFLAYFPYVEKIKVGL